MKRKDATAVLYQRIARYMRTRGWLLVMAGPISVESRGKRFCYRFVWNFVGKPIKRVQGGER